MRSNNYRDLQSIDAPSSVMGGRYTVDPAVRLLSERGFWWNARWIGHHFAQVSRELKKSHFCPGGPGMDIWHSAGGLDGGRIGGSSQRNRATCH